MGRWDVHTVAYEPPLPYGLGSHPRFVIDATGTFHIAHVSQNDGAVFYSSGSPGAFATERVGVTRAAPTETSPASLAIAGDGTLHLGWTRDAELGVVHRWRAPGGAWSAEGLPLELGLPGTEHPSLALFADGTPFIVGLGGPAEADPWEPRDVLALGGGDPMTLGRTGTAWALRISVAVTADGFAHALFPASAGELVLSTWAPGGVLTTRNLDGDWGSLTVAPDGTLRVVFTRSAGDHVEIVHATHTAAGAAVREEVVAAPPEAYHLTLAVTSAGAVHVSFDLGGAVAYATNAGGAWAVEEIEVTSTQNGRPALALDPSDGVWIAYRDVRSRLVVATPAR